MRLLHAESLDLLADVRRERLGSGRAQFRELLCLLFQRIRRFPQCSLQVFQVDIVVLDALQFRLDLRQMGEHVRRRRTILAAQFVDDAHAAFQRVEPMLIEFHVRAVVANLIRRFLQVAIGVFHHLAGIVQLIAEARERFEVLLDLAQSREDVQRLASHIAVQERIGFFDEA